MAIKYHSEIEQGSKEWFEIRCGLLTASEMDRIISPPPEKETKIKKNGEPYKQREWKIFSEDDECYTHLFELAAQRVNSYVEAQYVGDDMLRGKGDELLAKILYNEKYAPLTDCGFITNDEWGFTLGYSPDGLIKDEGQIECKSRRQKFQFETIYNCKMPSEFIIQVQTGLLVSRRQWCDFISYNGGMHMLALRIYPSLEIQNAIIVAATTFHERLKEAIKVYQGNISNPAFRLLPTERQTEQEITI